MDRIKKGDKFKCIKDVVMNTGETAYIKGRIYLSEDNCCITDEQGCAEHNCDDQEFRNEFFVRVGNIPETSITYTSSGLKSLTIDLQGAFNTKPSTKDHIIGVCDEIKNILLSKNEKYGDSALSNGILFNIPRDTAIKARINDKLSRLKNLGLNDSEDTLTDLIGYLILWKIARENDLP